MPARMPNPLLVRLKKSNDAAIGLVALSRKVTPLLPPGDHQCCRVKESKGV